MSSAVALERMCRHGLCERPAATVAAAAALDCGIQAQDLGAARLAVRARSATLTAADVDAALGAERTVVRTWLMRNTIHLVPARDVRWLTALLGPMIRRRFGTRRWPELGLTPDVLDAAARLAPQLLADGPLGRHELAAALAGRGVPIRQDGQAPVHVLVFLSTLGLTCHASGGRFALLDDWLPGAAEGPRGDDALAELARRWITAYSPATAADFTTWSGLPSGRALGLIRDELQPAEVDGRPGFRPGAPRPCRGGVRLLGGFDTVLVAYRDRATLIDASHRDQVYSGGIIRPTVVHDGRVIGRWRLGRPASAARPLRVEVTLFAPAPRTVRAAVRAEAEDIGRFLAAPVRLDLT